MNAIEHCIEIAAQPGELVVRLRGRNPLREIAALNFKRGPPDCTDPVLELPPKEEGAGDGHRNCRKGAPQAGAPHQLIECLLVLHVAADHEQGPVSQGGYAQAALRGTPGPLDGELLDRGYGMRNVRGYGQVACKLMAIRTDQSIDLRIRVDAVAEKARDMGGECVGAVLLVVLDQSMRR